MCALFGYQLYSMIIIIKMFSCYRSGCGHGGIHDCRGQRTDPRGGQVRATLPVPLYSILNNILLGFSHIITAYRYVLIVQCLTVTLLENMVWIFGALEKVPPLLRWGSNLLTFLVEGRL